MKDNDSWLTPRQASVIAGCTSRSITNMITDGRLSASKEDGKYYIQKSEFFRLYPHKHQKEKENEGIIMEKLAERDRMKCEIELLREMSSQKDREIDFLREQLASGTFEKSKMLEAIVATTRLIEHQKK